MSILFPIIYLAALIFLIWKAFKVMSGGWGAMNTNKLKKKNNFKIHPELLDKSGNITEEELLTVRFSTDTDSPIEKGTTSD